MPKITKGESTYSKLCGVILDRKLTKKEIHEAATKVVPVLGDLLDAINYLEEYEKNGDKKMPKDMSCLCCAQGAILHAIDTLGFDTEKELEEREVK